MYILLADCKMPVFWRRKSQSSLNNNNAYSSNQNLSEKRYRSSQPDMTVDINGGLHVKKNAARPKSLSSLGQKTRRSLTAPSTPETEAKSPLNGCSVGTDPISIQLGTSTAKTQVKSSSPVMSGNRKAVAKESSPTCSKSRSEKFHKLFKSVPEDETPLDYYSCAFIGDILLHGILYVSPNWICFYSKIRARGHHLMIPMEKVRNISREKTALIIPNAIGVQTEEEKYVFGSFLTRDSTYKFLVSTWKKSQDSTDSTKDQSISSPEPSKLTETPEFSPSATSSPLENNNVLPSVIASPKQPSIVSTSNVRSLVDSSDSETSMCPDCGLVDGSDSDRVRRSSANQISDVNTTQLSDTTKRPHVHNLSNCFQFHKTYKALCHMSVKLQRIPRTSLLLAICTVMVVFLIMSAVGLTYKLLLLQAKLESRHIWNDVLKFEHREKTYSDIHAFHSKVHTATIQQLHSVLQSNLELLEEMNASFRNLHKLYSPKANCESPTPSRGDDCS